MNFSNLPASDLQELSNMYHDLVDYNKKISDMPRLDDQSLTSIASSNAITIQKIGLAFYNAGIPILDPTNGGLNPPTLISLVPNSGTQSL